MADGHAPLVPMKTHPSNLSCQPIRCSIGFQHTAACKAVADVVHFRRHLCGQRLIIRCVIRPAAHGQHDQIRLQRNAGCLRPQFRRQRIGNVFRKQRLPGIVRIGRTLDTLRSMCTLPGSKPVTLAQLYSSTPAFSM